jgi:hypothetical protein
MMSTREVDVSDVALDWTYVTVTSPASLRSIALAVIVVMFTVYRTCRSPDSRGDAKIRQIERLFSSVRSKLRKYHIWHEVK